MHKMQKNYIMEYRSPEDHSVSVQEILHRAEEKNGKENGNERFFKLFSDDQ